MITKSNFLAKFEQRLSKLPAENLIEPIDVSLLDAISVVGGFHADAHEDTHIDLGSGPPPTNPHPS